MTACSAQWLYQDRLERADESQLRRAVEPLGPSKGSRRRSSQLHMHRRAVGRMGGLRRDSGLWNLPADETKAERDRRGETMDS